jgi:Uma2 family endonuclease
MSITIEEPVLASEIPPFPVRRFTVDEYHRMINSGVFDADEPFELLEGWIVPKMTRNPPHDVAIVLAAEALRSRVPEGWHVRAQVASTTSDSELKPDFTVVRGGPRDYLVRHPGGTQTALVVEIADSSLSRDRIDKARVYARAGIAVYWIVNLVDSLIEVYTSPTGPHTQPNYQSRRDYRPGESIPVFIGGVELDAIAVNDLLP